MAYLIYIMFQSGEWTMGKALFLAGCALMVLSGLAAVILAATGRESRRRLEQKMREKYQ